MARPIARPPRRPAELLEFVRPRHHGILTTAPATAARSSSPVTMGVDDPGRSSISTYPERGKAVNSAPRPAGRVLCSPTSSTATWVQVDGTAEVHRPARLGRAARRVLPGISGEHPDWDEYRQAMRDQGKSLIRGDADRWGP